MKYSRTGLEPESRVTQRVSQEKRIRRRASSETVSLNEANKALPLTQALTVGDGFIYGLLVGVLATAVLAVIVLQ